MFLLRRPLPLLSSRPVVSRRASTLLIGLAAAPPGALAQNAAKPGAAAAAAPLAWPTKPLKIIVGFPAGSSPDLTARTFSEPLSKALGPLSLTGTSPLILTAPVSQPGVPANSSARDFFVAARNGGDKWSYGTPGVGTVGHIGTELLKSRSNINPVHVPYPGYPQVATAMLGGQLQMALLPPALAQAQVRAGKLRAIGVTSSGRSPLAPDVPSLVEAGISNFNLEIWNAFAAPSTLPKPIQAKLAALISEIARSEEVRGKLFQQGWQTVGSSPEGLANRVKADTNLLGGVIAMRGIKAE